MAAKSIISMNHSAKYQRELETDDILTQAEKDAIRAQVEEQAAKDRAKYAERQASYIIGAPVRVSDERGEALAAFFCDGDPRTPAQIEADLLDAETRATHESARPY